MRPSRSSNTLLRCTSGKDAYMAAEMYSQRQQQGEGRGDAQEARQLQAATEFFLDTKHFEKAG